MYKFTRNQQKLRQKQNETGSGAQFESSPKRKEKVSRGSKATNEATNQISRNSLGAEYTSQIKSPEHAAANGNT